MINLLNRVEKYINLEETLKYTARIKVLVCDSGTYFMMKWLADEKPRNKNSYH